MSNLLQPPAAVRRLRKTALGAAKTKQAVSPPAYVPDWSERTLELLSGLSPVERAFVEWYASGLSAAESYRRAVGRIPGPASDASRQQGYKLRARPRVKAAIESCLADRNVGARLDREALLAKLYALISACEGSDHPRDKARLVAAVLVIARMQGYLTGRQPSPPPAAKANVVSEPSQRLADLIAKAQAALGPAVKKTQANAGDADQDARTLGLPSAHPATPQPSSIPITVAAGDQLASAVDRGRSQPRGYGMVTREPCMGVG